MFNLWFFVGRRVFFSLSLAFPYEKGKKRGGKERLAKKREREMGGGGGKSLELTGSDLSHVISMALCTCVRSTWMPVVHGFRLRAEEAEESGLAIA